MRNDNAALTLIVVLWTAEKYSSGREGGCYEEDGGDEL